MNTLAVVFLCFQACLVQTVFSQCVGAYGPAATIAPATLNQVPCGANLGVFAPSSFGYPAGISGLAPGLAGPYGFAGSALGYDGLAYPGAAPYGGAGEGNVAVAGELPVAGTTALAGQVPIMGAVNFGGSVPAAGVVSISGNCACGCGSNYLY